MLIVLQHNDARPIYQQIVQQVKYAVASGVLEPGAMVPSVQKLAQKLLINPNTVVRAYRELQNEGILRTVRGTGLQVTPRARPRCRDDRLQAVRERLRMALEEARQSGLKTEEVEELVRQEFRRVQGRSVLVGGKT
jgi:GntR family transcriptional regulator